MLSNEPLERLLSTMIALDGHGGNPAAALEMRCLMRKIDWVASEADAALKRLTPPACIVTPLRVAAA